MAFRTQKEKKAFRVGVITGAKKANKKRKTRVVVRSLKKRKARKIRR